ncbi:GOLPH3/VPS74 family protein [Intrasporangium sp. YIM S08009]|uniref:GOLPH3/VPS74 family protein n=1 Tax=Intrasporangium zincisolvens TaxID=3080018 RepID=UPI002B059D6D|nr:GPP34 family phosphoprotein [Intrasporangium sp. YIM S08009]
MLIAEDLLLLLTDDDTGRLVASGSMVDIALGGALLVELALAHRIGVDDSDGGNRHGRIVVRDGSLIGDDVLDQALATVTRKEGKKTQSVVTALAKGTRVRLYGRLVDAGELRAESGRVLGIIPARRWPSQDVDHETGVHGELVAALQRGTATDARTGALIALLSALRAVHTVVDPVEVGLSKRELKERAGRIAEGDWAADAVRSAIDSLMAAVVAASASAAVAAGSGS